MSLQTQLQLKVLQVNKWKKTDITVNSHKSEVTPRDNPGIATTTGDKINTCDLKVVNHSIEQTAALIVPERGLGSWQTGSSNALEQSHGLVSCVCGKDIYLNLKQEVLHKKVHDGQELYSCDQCEHKATKIQYLNTHKEVKQEVLKHCCDQCPDQLNQKQNLTSHKKSVHGFMIKCELCDKQFVDHHPLDKHKESK